ncbi:hypothetical protein D3C80_1964920 [compost metagenome]
MAADEHNLNLRVHLLSLTGELHPCHNRHPDVRENNIYRVLLHYFKGGKAAGSRSDAMQRQMAASGHAPSQPLQINRLIIHQ